MRTTLVQFEQEMNLAIKEFWGSEHSMDDAVLVCWTEDDDQLHGGFCKPSEAINRVHAMVDLKDSGKATIQEVLDTVPELGTRIMRVVFLSDDIRGLQMLCCEESPAGEA